VGSLQWALSWLIVVAVGLAPLLVYWLAWLIGPGDPSQSAASAGE
jgi:hypothetical protein